MCCNRKKKVDLTKPYLWHSDPFFHTMDHRTSESKEGLASTEAAFRCEMAASDLKLRGAYKWTGSCETLFQLDRPGCERQ